MILLMWSGVVDAVEPVDASEVVREVVLEVTPRVAEIVGRSFESLPTVVVTDFRSEKEHQREVGVLNDEDIEGHFGRYVWETDQLLVFWDRFEPTLSLDPSGAFTRRALRCVVAHELTHALDRADRFESTLSAMLVSEGHATRVMSEVCADDLAALAFLKGGGWDNIPGPLDSSDARFRYDWAERYVTWLERTGPSDAIQAAFQDPPDLSAIWDHGVPGPEGLAATPFPTEDDARELCAAVGEELAGYRSVPGAISGPKIEAAEDYALRWSARGATRFICGPLRILSWDVGRRPGEDGTRDTDDGWEIDRYTDARWVVVTGPSTTRRSVGDRLIRALDALPAPEPRWVPVALASGSSAANAVLGEEIAAARFDMAGRAGQALGQDLSDLTGVFVAAPEGEALARMFGLTGVGPEEWFPGTDHFPWAISVMQKQVLIPWRLVADTLKVDPSGALTRAWLPCAVAHGMADVGLHRTLRPPVDAEDAMIQHLIAVGQAARVSEQLCDDPAARAWLRSWWWDPERCFADDPETRARCVHPLAVVEAPPPALSWNDPQFAFGVGHRIAETAETRGETVSALLASPRTWSDLWARGAVDPLPRPVADWPDAALRDQLCAAVGEPASNARREVGGAAALRVVGAERWRTALEVAERTRGTVSWSCGETEVSFWLGDDLGEAFLEPLDGDELDVRMAKTAEYGTREGRWIALTRIRGSRGWEFVFTQPTFVVRLAGRTGSIPNQAHLRRFFEVLDEAPTDPAIRP